MKRTFFSLALLLAVATLTAQTKMTAREAAVKIADRILASTTYEFKNTKTGEIYKSILKYSFIKEENSLIFKVIFFS